MARVSLMDHLGLELVEADGLFLARSSQEASGAVVLPEQGVEPGVPAKKPEPGPLACQLRSNFDKAGIGRRESKRCPGIVGTSLVRNAPSFDARGRYVSLTRPNRLRLGQPHHSSLQSTILDPEG